MSRDASDKKPIIDPGMTIPDIISRYCQTVAVSNQYDEKACVYLCVACYPRFFG